MGKIDVDNVEDSGEVKGRRAYLVLGVVVGVIGVLEEVVDAVDFAGVAVGVAYIAGISLPSPLSLSPDGTEGCGGSTDVDDSVEGGGGDLIGVRYIILPLFTLIMLSSR